LPSTRSPHVPHPPHEGRTEGGDSGGEGSSGGRHDRQNVVVFRFVFLYLSCKLILFVVIMYLRIHFGVISHL
jgi:hypothetical protein